MKITDEHYNILKHTVSGHHYYCGDSPQMQELVEHGLMKCCGTMSVCDDLYFDITADGKVVCNMATSLKDMGKTLSIDEEVQ